MLFCGGAHVVNNRPLGSKLPIDSNVKGGGRTQIVVNTNRNKQQAYLEFVPCTCTSQYPTLSLWRHRIEGHYTAVLYRTGCRRLRRDGSGADQYWPSRSHDSSRALWTARQVPIGSLPPARSSRRHRRANVRASFMLGKRATRKVSYGTSILSCSRG